MTIKELKEIIKDLPEDMYIYVDERLTEYAYGAVNSADVTTIDIMDEFDQVDRVESVLIFSEQ